MISGEPGVWPSTFSGHSASLEEELSSYVGTQHALGVSSGSDALIISLMALQVDQGDAVVTTPFTFFATGGAIARLGADPVFCDIDPDTFNIDTHKLAELLEHEIENKGNSRIKGIIPVHLYGQCVDMAPIQSLAEKYGLFVLEDAALAQHARAEVVGDLAARHGPMAAGGDHQGDRQLVLGEHVERPGDQRHPVVRVGQHPDEHTP